VPWYKSTAVRMANGRTASLATILLCRAVPGMSHGRGYSQQIMKRPNTTLRICRIGIGVTRGLRDFVAKSQKIFGQKKPWTPAPT